MGNSASRRILVTGGAGFIGAHLVRRLLNDRMEVVVIDDLSNGARSNVPEGAVFIQGDVRDAEVLDRAFEHGFEAVLHLAAQSSGALSFDDPDGDMQSHVVGTFRVLEACRRHGVKRFLYASSSTVYGEPDMLPVDEDAPLRPAMYYSAGKCAAESYLRFFERFGIGHTVLRMPNVYGPGQNLENKQQGMVSIYLSFMLEGAPILVRGALDRYRDFIYIDDVVDGWVRCLESRKAVGRTYNLASGKSRSVGDVIECLRAAWGDPGYPVDIAGGTPGDQSRMELSAERIRSELGFRAAHSLEEGVRKMVETEKERLG